jgi:putative endonuclease
VNMFSHFYILRLASGGIYCGSTRNREQRYKDHYAGRGCRTTHLDLPIKIEYEGEFQNYKEALKREKQIKRWSRAKKEALIKNDFTLLKSLSKRKAKKIV